MFLPEKTEPLRPVVSATFLVEFYIRIVILSAIVSIFPTGYLTICRRTSACSRVPEAPDLLFPLVSLLLS